jgi:hypothetical protein
VGVGLCELDERQLGPRQDVIYDPIAVMARAATSITIHDARNGVYDEARDNCGAPATGHWWHFTTPFSDSTFSFTLDVSGLPTADGGFSSPSSGDFNLDTWSGPGCASPDAGALNRYSKFYWSSGDTGREVCLHAGPITRCRSTTRCTWCHSASRSALTAPSAATAAPASPAPPPPTPARSAACSRAISAAPASAAATWCARRI